MEDQEQKLKRKKNKKLGPIRTGAVVPTLVIILLIFVYFRFLFDSQLKKMIEWGGSYIYGAEINVESVETSFLKLSFALNGLQVTDKAQPTQNLFSVKRMHFQLLPDALLRAKFVIEDASIDDIGISTPRKHKGYVRPPEPPTSKKDKNSEIAKIEQRARERLAQDYSDNALGNIAKILGGSSAKDQLKDIQVNLETSKKIDEIMEIIERRKKDAPQELKALPQKQDFDKLLAQAKALKFDTKNPIQFAKDVKEANSLYKQADGMIKTVKEKTESVKKDIATLEGNIKSLDSSVQNDVASIKNRLSLPSFDPQKFSQSLFVSIINDKITGAEKYSTTISSLMSSSSQKKKEETLVPKARSQGRNIRFPITTSYPLFWLKRAAISSHANTSQFSGDVSGEVKDITTEPTFTKKPMVLEVSGNFPKQEVRGFQFKAQADMFKEMKKTFSMDVASYPFIGMSMVNSKDVVLNLKKSMASLSLSGEMLDGGQFQMALKNIFKSNDFEIDAKQALVKKVLTNVIHGLNEIVLNASIGGTFNKFETHLNSNLGSELAEGFKREIANEFKSQTQAQAIEDMVKNKIQPQKEKLNKEMQAFKTQYLGEFQKSEKEIQSVADQTKSQLSQQGGAEEKNLSPKDLLKGFKKGLHL